jgi:hypothetical protein
MMTQIDGFLCNLVLTPRSLYFEKKMYKCLSTLVKDTVVGG